MSGKPNWKFADTAIPTSDDAPTDEPQIHSHYEDSLPGGHPLAYKALYCGKCEVMLHCGTNECMQTWVEWQGKQVCLKCFILLQPDPEVLVDLPKDLPTYIR